MWSIIKENQDLMAYFSDQWDLQVPEKKFLYGILCTIRPDEVREIIAARVKNRSPVEKEDKGDLIKVTKDMKDSIMTLFAMKSK